MKFLKVFESVWKSTPKVYCDYDTVPYYLLYKREDLYTYVELLLTAFHMALDTHAFYQRNEMIFLAGLLS